MLGFLRILCQLNLLKNQIADFPKFTHMDQVNFAYYNPTVSITSFLSVQILNACVFISTVFLLRFLFFYLHNILLEESQ